MRTVERTFYDKILRVVQDDITERNVDAIVNPANSHFQHGGGVAGAIVQKGGPIIQQESNTIGYLPVSCVAITSAGRLNCKAIIHAVGPRFGEGDEDTKLMTTITNILSLATDQNFKSLSIPTISTGIFGFPKDRCAHILVDGTKNFIEHNKTSLRLIEFCTFDNEAFCLFKDELDHLK